LTGTLSTDEGTVRFGNSRLRIGSALLEFEARDPYNPSLRATLRQDIRGYRVTVSVTGSLEDPEVLLDSSPPLEREKLVVLIATGQTLEQIEDQGIERFAAIETVKYVGRSVADYLSSGADPTEKGFLDRFTLETEGATKTYLEELYRVEFLVEEDLLLDRSRLFLQSERDWYGDYNFNVGFRLEIE
jgi:translocation and assembly module TamB